MITIAASNFRSDCGYLYRFQRWLSTLMLSFTTGTTHEVKFILFFLFTQWNICLVDSYCAAGLRIYQDFNDVSQPRIYPRHAYKLCQMHQHI